MNPATHFLAGWTLANSVSLNPRERLAVSIAAIIPDTDGLGAISDLFSTGFGGNAVLFSAWHHTFGHGLPFGIAVAAALAAGLSKNSKAKVLALCLVSFHLHLLMDLAGARGPDGYTWPIPYLYPFAGPMFEWSGQWELTGWQNFLITGLLLVWAFRIAWKTGATPIETFFPKTGEKVVKTLRARFGEPVRNGGFAITDDACGQNRPE